MDLKLAGRAAIVLAASDGLGRSIASALVREEVDVAICGRDEDRIQRAAAELRQLRGGKVFSNPCDVSNPQALDEFIGTATRELGQLDILVTNAGGPPSGQFVDLEDSVWESAFQLIVMSAVRAIHASLPALQRSDQARIISIVSSSVRQPIAGLTLSNVFRPALSGLIKTLSVELASDGILVNAVAPGRIDTERVRSMDRGRAERQGTSVEQIQRLARGNIPLGRYGEPAELANVVTFLASAAAGYMTGSVLMVDGGMVKSLP